MERLAYEKRMRDDDCYKLLVSLVKDDVLALTGVLSPAAMWDTFRPSEANLNGVNMGLVTPTALGLALALPHRKVLAIEGDGSAILNMGNLAQIAWTPANNLVVFIMDNGCYVGPDERFSTPTATVTDLEAVAKGSGVKNSTTAWTLEEFKKAAGEALEKNELSVVVAKIRFTASHSRPAHVRFGDEEKYILMRYLERTEKKRLLWPRGYRLSSQEWSLFGVDEKGA